MVSHVSLGAIQQPLELESVGVPVSDDVAHLPHDRREYEYAYQVAHYCEHVSEGKILHSYLYEQFTLCYTFI